MEKPKSELWQPYAFGALFVALLAGVRMFEQHLFYDPFLLYFQGEFHSQPLPDFDAFYLFCGFLFRYGLNTIFSLGLIYTVFGDKSQLKFALFLYGMLFVALVFAFFGLVYFAQGADKMLLFYVRRFLIQPLFVILFIPAFYYQKRVYENNR